MMMMMMIIIITTDLFPKTGHVTKGKLPLQHVL